MEFTKMQGIGNDYIYFNCLEKELKNPSEVAIKLSDRHFGVGGDGIIMIMSSEVADFRMRMFNADGSEGEMCGNATRCIGKYVYEKGLTDKTKISLETLAGIKYLELNVQNGIVTEVKVNMGKPILDPKKIPVDINKEIIINEVVKIDNNEYNITCVSMGNPHCVSFTEGIDDLDLEKIGPSFENHKLFPDRINTEFVEVIDDHTIKMRVWERGSGETISCGTGTCASVVAAVLNGFCKRGEEVEVQMKGPATTVFDGEIDV